MERNDRAERLQKRIDLENRNIVHAAARARRERNARLAARDAEWAAWRAANGVAEKTVETRNDGTTVVTYGRRIVSAPPWAVPGHI